jgi:hypothetical protein
MEFIVVMRLVVALNGQLDSKGSASMKRGSRKPISQSILYLCIQLFKDRSYHMRPLFYCQNLATSC